MPFGLKLPETGLDLRAVHCRATGRKMRGKKRWEKWEGRDKKKEQWMKKGVGLLADAVILIVSACGRRIVL